jgi:hypothetical protein
MAVPTVTSLASKNAIMQNVINSLNNLYRQFYYFQKNRSFNTKLSLDDPSKNPLIFEQRHRGFGRCYSIHLIKEIRDLGIYYIKMEL